MKQLYLFKILFILSIAFLTNDSWAQYQMENLDRGVVATSMGGTKVFVSWRWLGTEPDNITFNLYRGTTKLNATPLTVSNYTDNAGSTTASYTVRAILNGVEQTASKSASTWAQQFLKVPLQIPAGGTTPDGVAYTYNANDASVADLDGDGQYEIILKWDPSNSKDNSQSGYTGNTYVDAYKLNGTRMWRIDFGKNIRSGAHYMDFMVYDFDGDGKAEMMCRTGDGTKDGVGTIIGTATADYRSTAGYVLTGPEYISVFNGLTGAVMATSNYIPARGTVSSWGDSYGNRVDRFRAGVAYVDGQHPTGIFSRGYYTRAVVAAWDWRGGKLTNRWTFDSNTSGNGSYAGQGDHSLSIADVDNDGKQEIIVGSAIIDDNGSGYYNTTFGHGDALHVSDLDPSLPGLEVFNIQERVDAEGAYMYSATNKKVLWTKPTTGNPSEGPGRGVSGDITAAFKGAEAWVAGGGIPGTFDCKGNQIATTVPSSCNFLVWWDGDLLRELLNNTMIDKYGVGRMLSAYNLAPITSNNGTKSTPALSGDIFGDWREEVIWRGSANDALYIFTTNIPSTYKFRTLMHDPQYRVAIAWQNTGYNQPPHVGFYLGDGMTMPVAPNIAIIGQTTVNQFPTANITAPANNASFIAPATVSITANAADADGTVSKVDFYNGNTLLGSDATTPYTFTWTNVTAGSYSLTVKATDNNGAVTTSAPITVVVNAANVAPTVSITAPLNNASFTAPTSITINATAADADGTVSNVQFYSGTTLLGSDATSPYSLAYTVTVAGTYTLTAKATDNAGLVTTSTSVIVVVKAPNVAPTVSITSPVNNAVFNSLASIAITANAADADGTVSNVQLFNGTTLLATMTTSPYIFTWTNVPVGTYNITAKATDNSGAVTSSAPIQVTVTCAPTAITPYIQINAGVWVQASNASLNQGGSVKFGPQPTTGGSWSWSGPNGFSAAIREVSLTNIQAVQAGNYVATYTNSAGCNSTSTFAVNVTIPNQAPSVSIASPSNNTIYTIPASIEISANAADADGTVSSVEFFVGSTLLASDATSPYSFSWTNAAAGSYIVTAQAIDNSGSVTTSSPVAITVLAVSPIIQAETACAVDGVLSESINAGFNGSGYVNTTNVLGSTVSWTLNSQVAQSTVVTFRYANASANNRNVSVKVNGITQIVNVDFLSTGAWTTWNTVAIPLTLASGSNTIQFVSLMNEGAANLDQMSFNTGGISQGTCQGAVQASLLTSDPAQISPNPSSGSFTIDVLENAESITVVNSNGLVVFTSGALAAGETLVFGNSFTSGIYVVNILYTSGSMESRKIQKTL